MSLFLKKGYKEVIPNDIEMCFRLDSIKLYLSKIGKLHCCHTKSITKVGVKYTVAPNNFAVIANTNLNVHI